MVCIDPITPPGNVFPFVMGKSGLKKPLKGRPMGSECPKNTNFLTFILQIRLRNNPIDHTSLFPSDVSPQLLALKPYSDSWLKHVRKKQPSSSELGSGDYLINFQRVAYLRLISIDHTGSPSGLV